MNRLTQGVLAAWALVLLELGAVALVQRRAIASAWELELGALWLAPSALMLATLVGALGTLVFALLRSADRSSRARHGLAALTAVAAFAVAWGVGGGRHLSEIASRGGFALMVGAGLSAVILVASRPLARTVQTRPRLSAASLVALIVALELSNQFVLRRLYPAFHWGLSLLTLLLAPAAWLCIAPVRPSRRRLLQPVAALVAVVAGAAALVPSARKLSHFDNFRLLLLEHAPLLGRSVELSARIAPPAPWDPEPCAQSMVGVGCAEAAPALATPQSLALDFRGRDFLLISIDALRADHVGAYGYARPTTPNIDRLAAAGAVFEAAYSATPHTSYAVTSLMTGKHMRPLLLQGAGGDSDTWASLLRTYGYRTAAFYPPAVFFIDTARFEELKNSNLGFEYAKVEFAEGEPRITQVTRYLTEAPHDKPLFLWLHLFGPHEPYVNHEDHRFGDRDVDRYDSEIADADATVGRVVSEFRRERPRGVVIVTADHGEEFGDHGGRYHGTTVYEEQVRVPLVISAPGALGTARFREVVQSIDLLPTVLGSLAIPRPPRVRGRDLGPLLARKRAEEPGFAYAETDEQTLLARGSLRLICLRRIGACRLFDLASDPGEQTDLAPSRRSELESLRAQLREVTASHGRFESQGLRAEGKGWPAPILRGLSGDADSAPEIASLLDDVDPTIRRKAAELLFELRRPESAPALRLALGRDDDPDVRRYAALALTRLGEGAPLVLELLDSPELKLRRLAALALGESGDKRGGPGLLEWWRDAKSRDFTRSRQMLEAFATLRLKDAAPLLFPSLRDVRLRPYVAAALAKIGEESARVPLARAFAEERSQSVRVELGRALVALGAKEEMAAPLVRFLGVPDPLTNGLELALASHVLKYVGGPNDRDLPQLRSRSGLGARLRVVVPKAGNGTGVRAIVRASCERESGAGDIVLSSARHLTRYDKTGKPLPERGLPELDPNRALRLRLPCEGHPLEVLGTLPESIGVRPGTSTELIFFASRNVALEAVALVPLADELPPPPPKPWTPESPGE